MSMFPPDFPRYEQSKVRAVVEKSDLVSTLFAENIDNLPTLSRGKDVGSVLESLEYPVMETRSSIDCLYTSPEQTSQILKEALEKNRIEIAPASHIVDLVKLADYEGQRLPGNIATT